MSFFQRLCQHLLAPLRWLRSVFADFPFYWFAFWERVKDGAAFITSVGLAPFLGLRDRLENWYLGMRAAAKEKQEDLSDRAFLTSLSWREWRENASQRWRRDPNAPEAPWSTLPENILERSFARLNLVGYILLSFSAIEYATIIYPPQLTDVRWEFETIGRMVSNIWGFVFGFTFVFCRVQAPVRKVELKLLANLSRLTALIGALFLLLFPLGTINAARINYVNGRVHQVQVQQLETQFRRQQELLSSPSLSPQILSNLATSLDIPLQGDRPLQARVLARIETNYQRSRSQLQQQYRRQRTQLFENAIQWNVGCLLIAFTFFWMWWLTRDYREALRLS